MEIEVLRLYQDKGQTEGILYLRDASGKLIFECVTLELPWKENKNRVSCIPEGTYRAIKHTSPKLGKSLWLQDVEGRSEILVHKGNYSRQILGCLLVGKEHIDIDKDGLIDVTASTVTMNKLLGLIKGNEINIKIGWRP